MGSLSSDSSDDDLDEYIATNTLLGYASKDPTDDPVNQLGGRPSWPDPENPPSAALAKCKVCNRMMTLLLQLNGDLPERFPSHERRLYIFACRSKTCKKKAGSIRAVRGSKVSRPGPSAEANPQNASPTPKAPAPMLGDSIFGTTTSSTSSSNPFSTSSTATSTQDPFSTTSTANPLNALASKPPQRPVPDLPTTFAEKARISSPPPSSPVPPPEPWRPESALPPPYPSYYLDADYETLDKSSPPTPPKPLSNIDAETSSGSGGKEDAAAYESTLDKTFQKFASRLSHNPLQVLRYEMGGTPLLYAKDDGVGKMVLAGRIPRCEGCGAGRMFELQLVPQAIAELEVEEVGLEGMEWGTVVLAVCGRDCGAAGEGWGWREEWVGVQWEESAGGGGGVGVR